MSPHTVQYTQYQVPSLVGKKWCRAWDWAKAHCPKQWPPMTNHWQGKHNTRWETTKKREESRIKWHDVIDTCAIAVGMLHFALTHVPCLRAREQLILNLRGSNWRLLFFSSCIRKGLRACTPRTLYPSRRQCPGCSLSHEFSVEVRMWDTRKANPTSFVKLPLQLQLLNLSTLSVDGKWFKIPLKM